MWSPRNGISSFSELPLSGCRLTAADVNGDTAINTVDVIAIQRFFLGLSTGIANTGKYQFSPASRTYPGIVTDQTGQNYDTLVFGDVVTPFAERLDGSQTGAGDGTSGGEWAAPPDQFIFIDADLNTQQPSNLVPGSVTPSGKPRESQRPPNAGGRERSLIFTKPHFAYSSPEVGLIIPVERDSSL